MNTNTVKKYWKKFWHFIWEEDSLLSWAANILLAFVLIKFIVYPGLGFLFGTTHPVVAVMSSSMEHNDNFDIWWENDIAFCDQRVICRQKDFYALYNISHDEFTKFRFSNGFNTGDIMIVTGARPEKIKTGDVIVYWGGVEAVPIIHRVIAEYQENGKIYFKTKGDNNPGINFNEAKIDQKLVVGKAVLRVPYLGWVKIAFVRLVDQISRLFQ